MITEIKLTVSQFIEICNQSLDYTFPDLIVEGEVDSFKINQGKWVFFDLKEEDMSVNCFMPLSQLRAALTDGMKIQVRATPKLTRWGRFSLTVRQVMPVGEGSIKKSFELLKKKLTAEGLFDPTRKRPIIPGLTHIGVISSTAAAGYIDFLKILDNRWGGMKIQTINTQVQGMAAAEQIIRALDYFNQRTEVEAIVLVRGGGSADDLAIFNDEALVRAIAGSRIPVMTGIGHEVDESLADLAADVRASTPSNAAERLSLDRQEVIRKLQYSLNEIKRRILDCTNREEDLLRSNIDRIKQQILALVGQSEQHISETRKLLDSLNPENVLKRGYAILAGSTTVGGELKITTINKIITTEVKNVQSRI